MPPFTLSDLPLTLAAFLVAIFILVGAHEWGHFWVARRLGIRVLRFSFGWGRPLLKYTSPKDGVEYALCPLPLGGYVKLLGEQPDDPAVSPENRAASYLGAAPWKRVLVSLAGPAASLLLAVLIYWALLMVGETKLRPVVGQVKQDSPAALAGLEPNDLIVDIHGHAVVGRDDALVYLFDRMVDGSVELTVRGDLGKSSPRTVDLRLTSSWDTSQPDQLFDQLGFEFWRPDDPAIIQSLTAGGAAEQAGLKVGDVVVAVADKPIDDFLGLVKTIRALPGQTVAIRVLRDGSPLDAEVSIEATEERGRRIGRVGIGRTPPAVPPEMTTLVQAGPLAGIGMAFVKTWDAAALDFKVLGQMLTGKLSVKNMSGPVGIAEVTGHAARSGLLTFMAFVAFISVNIGILNLLPIPILDGGQVVYHLIEWVKGRAVSERTQLITQQIGIAMVIMLITLTLYNDIARHVS